MPCTAYCFSSLDGLHVEVWSGSDKQNGKPNLVCSIDRNTQPNPKHFVEIKNIKTYARNARVKGLISSANNKAEFVRTSSSTETEWQDSGTVYHTATNNVLTFSSAEITKTLGGRWSWSTGDESIEVVVEYEDLWNLGQINRVDVPSQPLVFKIVVR